MAYTGTSIVDYLNSVGQNSSYTNRAALAKANGISNYTGTAAQNTQLLSILNKPVATPAPVVAKPVATTPFVSSYTAPVSTPLKVSTPTVSNNTSSANTTPFVSSYTAPVSTPLKVSTPAAQPVSSAYNVPGAVNTSTAANPTFTQNLEPGMTGNEVKKLQDYLVSQGFMSQAQVNTGYGTYGPQTTAAVAAWQAKNGVDTAGYAGYFGPKSITAYNNLKSNGYSPVVQTPTPTTYDNLVSAGATPTQATNIINSTSSPTTNSTGINTSSLGTAMGAETPNASTTLNANDLLNTSNQTVKLSSIAPDLVAAGSVNDVNVSAGISGIIALLSASKTNDTAYNDINTKLNDLISNIGNQEEDFKAALEEQGANVYKQQVEETNLKIAQITGEINAFDSTTSTGLNGISDQAIPTGLLTGQSSAYQRQRDSGRAALASELSSYAALQQAYSNNLEIATNLAEASVEYKWNGITTKLSALQVQLGIAKEVMDTADAKQLNIVNLLLQDQQNQIAEKKDTENQINSILISAAANGAPLSLIQSAKNAGSAAGATVVLQQYLKTATTNDNATKTITVKNADGSEQVYQFNTATNAYDIPIGNGSSNVSANVAKIETATATKTLVDKILNNSALNNAVNPNAVASFKDNIFTFDNWNGNTQTFLGDMQKLTSQSTIDTLLNLKQAGGTLGALSDSERLMLQTAATSLNAWAILDKNGKAKGYNISETSFKEELNRIKTLAEKAIEKAGGSDSNSDGWF
jgi:hypothetical protein